METHIKSRRHSARHYLKWLLILRWPIILITIPIIAALATGAKSLSFSNDYRVFFDKSDSNLQHLEELHRIYSDDDPLVFVVTPKDGAVFSRETLSSIEWLTRQAWTIPHIQRVDSLQNFQFSRANGEDLVVSDLYRNGSSLSDTQIQEVKQVALAERQLVGRIVNAPATITAVIATFHLPGIDRQREIPEILDKAEQLRAELLRSNPNLEIRLTGGIRMSHAFTEASNQDAATLTPLMLILVAVILTVLLRSPLATLGALTVILFTIAATMGIAGLLGYVLSPISGITPNILLTIAVADSVHVLVDFRNHFATLARRGGHRRKHHRRLAILRALQQTIKPIFLTSLTTAIGFLTLNFSDSPPFRDLGNLVAIGVGIAFFLSVTFLPALVAVLPIRPGRIPAAHQPIHHDFFSGMADYLIHRRFRFVVALGLAVSILGAFLPSNELNNDMIKYFSEDTQFRKDWEYTTDNLTGLYPLEYSIRAKAPNGINDPEYLKVLDAFAQWFEAQPETLHVDSIIDIQKRLNKNLHQDDPAWHKLPDSTELAAQYLLLYEMSLPPGLELNDRINIDKSATRFTVTIKTLSSNAMLDLEERAKRWLDENAPEYMRAKATGAPLMFAHIGRSNIEGMIEGTIIEFILIAVILMIVLKSVGLGFLSLVPNTVPAIMAFGAWALINGKINLALSVVANMTLGIVVDDTVHFLTNYSDARKTLGLKPENAIRYTFRHVGKATAISTLVLASGFLVLTLSSFELTAQMGLLTAITIVFALFGDLFLLPSLLLLKSSFRGFRRDK